MRETGEIKMKACPTPTTLCWKKLKIGSWLQKMKQHCRINFLAIHQWTGVDGIDKLLITKSIAMNFYSYQSPEVGAGCLIISLRVSWPRSWASPGALLQHWWHGVQGRCENGRGPLLPQLTLFLQLLTGMGTSQNLLCIPLPDPDLAHSVLALKCTAEKKRGNKLWPVWDVLKWMCAVC